MADDEQKGREERNDDGKEPDEARDHGKGKGRDDEARETGKEGAEGKERNDSKDTERRGDGERDERKETDELDSAAEREARNHVRELRESFVAGANARNAAFGFGDAFGGDKFEGDKNIFVSAGKRPWSTSKIMDDRWRTITTRLAGTPSREALIQFLGREPVAVLQGPSGTGRRTTAFAALAHRLNELESVQGKDSPAFLSKAELRPNHGYVYDASGQGWSKRLTEADVLGCKETLAALGARLVILVAFDSDVSAVPGLVVRHQQPDPMDVLHKRLSDRQAGELYDVESVVQQVKATPSTPRDAVLLAEAIKSGLPSGRTVSEICSSMPAPMRREARAVLRQTSDQKDLGRRAFVIAGAVLDGLPTVEVCRAAYDLAKRLFKVEKQGKDARFGLLPFADMLDDWLEHAREERVQVIEENDRKLSFREGFAPAVLDAIWLDYVVAHQALLAWLADLAESGDLVTRWKAAQATARFAVYDFDYIREQCVDEWSNSGSHKLQTAAAWTLEALVAQSPPRLPKVAEMARDWARFGSGGQRSTAARLFGTHLGSRDPQAAMRALHTIALWDPLFLSVAVKEAVVDLYAAGAHDVVVSELLGWTASSRRSMGRLVSRCLTEIAQLPFLRRPPLLEQYDKIPAPTGELWRRVLTSDTCGQGPWKALRDWLSHGIEFTSLRTELFAEPSLRPRLRFYQLAPRPPLPPL